MKNILLILITALLFTACKKDDPTLPPQFRIQNDTPYRIEWAAVKLGTSENSYAALNPGEVSGFKSFSDYHWPVIKLRVNNKDVEFSILPFEGGNPGSGENTRTTAVIVYIASSDTFDVHFKN